MHAKLNVLNQSNSILSQYLAEIRDSTVQSDAMRFRRNIQRIGHVMAVEISKELRFEKQSVQTPLALAEAEVLAEQPVLAAILRAALPLHQGLLDVFDRADNAFISAYRKTIAGSDEFDVHIEYLSSPSVEGRTVLLCDPMLATGSSMVLAWQALLQRGEPDHTHIVTVIASQAGVDYTLKNLPDNVTLWVAAVDDELNSKAYIVPGLGDAGDLAYGTKE